MNEKTDVFSVNKDNSCQFNGFIDKTYKYIEKFQLLDSELWARFVLQFKTEADNDTYWRGEYWGKMMRGACFVYSYTKNEALYQVLVTTVSDMLSSADSLGRISTYGIEKEFDGWDLWCRKYVLLGMQYFLEICRDGELSEKISASMIAQVDYIISKIGDSEIGKKPITKTSRHWRGLNSSSILEPIVRLYKLTQKDDYLDFAKYIIDQGGTEIENIFELAYEDKLYPYQYPVTKAYEMISCFEGLLEYYRVTGEEKYKTAAINFADKILESDFTVIGSCGCTHEYFDHSTVRQANTNNPVTMQETCVTVTIMKFFYQLTLLTGNTKYSDAFEISFYNAYLGSVNTDKIISKIPYYVPNVSKEPLPFDSYSPLTAGVRGNDIGGFLPFSDGHYYGCCACIGAAGIGLVHKMSLMSTAKGFAMNLYINGVVTSKTQGGNSVTFRTETAYPADGKVKITVETESEESFELLLRNPSWSRNTSVSFNGMRIQSSLGYIACEKVWKNGDEIILEFDMRTRVVHPIPYGSQVLMNKVVWGHNYVVPAYDEEDPLAKKHIALCRGPIVLAEENRLGYSVDDPVDIDYNGDYVDIDFPENDIAPYEHVIEVCVPLKDGSKMHLTDYASAGKLWNDKAKMAAWILTV